MIDEKRLIESLRASLNTGKETFPIDLIIECIEQQPKVGDWIPCGERLPKIRQDCLVTVKYTGFMGMHGIWVKTGHMESENDWWGDCAGGEVIAWMPLPESYNPKGE